MGVLVKRNIQRLIRQRPPLIDQHDPNCLKSSTYDLRLGEEYIKNGAFDKLDENKKPYLEIPEHDVVVVSTYEKINIPTSLVGRFGIRLSLVMRGLVLNNEPQIDPGYSGKLFCLLYNLSDEPITLRYKQPFATIEFEETKSVASPYKDGYQGAEHIFDVVKDKLPKSGLRKLWDEFRDLRKDLTERIDRLYTWFFTMVAIIMAILGILVARILGLL